MTAVLLVESDPAALRRLLRDFAASGIAATGVTRIAELERWPTGLVVITDLAHFTPWWRTVGALQVIVLVDKAEDARTAIEQGATGWLVRSDAAVGIATFGLPS
jgi:hypothetical protein